MLDDCSFWKYVLFSYHKYIELGIEKDFEREKIWEQTWGDGEGKRES